MYVLLFYRGGVEINSNYCFSTDHWLSCCIDTHRVVHDSATLVQLDLPTPLFTDLPVNKIPIDTKYK